MRRFDSKAAARAIRDEVMREDVPRNELSNDVLGGVRGVRINLPLRSRDELDRHLRLMILELTYLLDRVQDRKMPEDGVMLLAHSRVKLLHSKLNPPGSPSARSAGGGIAKGWRD